jgi:hypothetical protein
MQVARGAAEPAAQGGAARVLRFNAVPAERRPPSAQREFFARNEAIRRRQLREDARRPGGELLEDAMRLSAFAAELRAAARRASANDS